MLFHALYVTFKSNENSIRHRIYNLIVGKAITKFHIQGFFVVYMLTSIPKFWGPQSCGNFDKIGSFTVILNSRNMLFNVTEH